MPINGWCGAVNARPSSLKAKNVLARRTKDDQATSGRLYGTRFREARYLPGAATEDCFSFSEWLATT
jgi:hypothetical protein